MKDTQGRQTEIFQRVEALVDNSQYHYETGRLVDQEARCSREAWAHSIGLSSAVYFELQGYMTHTWGFLAMDLGEIRALQAREQARAGAPKGKMAPKKAAPKRTTRLNPGATPNPNPPPSTTTITITNAQLQAMIDQGVNTALATREANRTGALTWWNSHVRIVGNDAAYVMTWIELKTKMADKYCPRSEMKKIETEFWNLEVQEESDRVERYIGGLPDTIYGSVAASKPKTMQEATEMATGLMDKKIHTYAERQDVAWAYATGSGNRQQYAGSRPLCPKCNFNHDGPCTPRCYKCNKSGHLSRDCRSLTNATVGNNQRGNGAGQKVICYECGARGHFKRYCPKLKNNNNNNRGNQVRTGNARERVYAVGNAGTNPDANIVTGTFLLNNCYASMLFDAGADRIFVSFVAKFVAK
nr:hypothetical protein [Tanacetum cinerariifolium]